MAYLSSNITEGHYILIIDSLLRLDECCCAWIIWSILYYICVMLFSKLRFSSGWYTEIEIDGWMYYCGAWWLSILLLRNLLLLKIWMIFLTGIISLWMLIICRLRNCVKGINLFIQYFFKSWETWLSIICHCNS